MINQLNAVLDLGSHTFQLLIYDKTTKMPVFSQSYPTKIGVNGLEKRWIQEDALLRAIAAIKDCQNICKEKNVDVLKLIGTSAIRNAQNKDQFTKAIFDETGLEILVLSGIEEAEYIYEGVKNGIGFTEEVHLIMDIGGGSVEFILCNNAQVFWKKSFEIGGLRLMEKFMKTDPIHFNAMSRLEQYLVTELRDLANACHQYHPKILVGSAGSFDTLKCIHERMFNEPFTSMTLDEFHNIHELIVTADLTERRKIPGMIDLRVEMIVVAVCLISFVLKTFEINTIKVSSFSLKEGAMFKS